MTDQVSEAQLDSRDPVGIGGWLIFPIIGFVGTIIVTILYLVHFFVVWDIKAIMAGSEGAIVALRLPILFSFVGAGAIILSAALCLYLIFAKHRAIVPVAIAHYITLAVAGFVDVGVGMRVAEIAPGTQYVASTTTDAIRGVVILAIWGTYFAVSKRVRNTFIEPREAIAAHQPYAFTGSGS